MPLYNVVVTPSPASPAAVRSTAVLVEPSRRLPEINSTWGGRFITIMLVGVTLGVRVTPTTIMPLSGSPDAVQLAALRAGDELTEVVDQLSPRMLGLARVYVTSVDRRGSGAAWVVVLRSLTGSRAALRLPRGCSESW